MNIDIIVAISIFIISVTFIIFLVFSYVSNQLTLKEMSDIRLRAIEVFRKFVAGDFSVTKTIYRIPVLIKEPNFDDRENEFVELFLTLDFNCQLNITNTSIFITDENFQEIEFNKTVLENCFEDKVKSIEIYFNINISKNEEKNIFVYFHDENVVARNFSVVINTNSFAPKDGDKYTESNNSWERIGGTNSLPEVTSIKKIGEYAVKIEDFPTNKIGLSFNFPTNPADRFFDNLVSVNTSWFLRAYLYTNSTTSIKNFNISLEDSFGNVIFKNFSLNIGWNIFEEELNSTNWYNWTSFNPNNITKFSFIAENESISPPIFLAVDGLRFEKKPLNKIIYPIESVEVVSKDLMEKVKDEELEILRRTYGDKFYIEISK